MQAITADLQLSQVLTLPKLHLASKDMKKGYHGILSYPWKQALRDPVFLYFYFLNITQMEAYVIDYTTETRHPNKGENAKQR